MSEKLRVLDTDSHVAEPADLFEGEYMEPNYRGASPFRFNDRTDERGRKVTTLWQGGKILIDNAAFMAGAGLPFDKVFKEGIRYSEANEGGWNAKKRVADMDLEGIEHQIINPSIPGLRIGFVEDPHLAAALCRAYNDWVTDHCEAANGRVSATMVLPWQDIELALAELKRVADRACLRGAVILPAPEYSSGFVGDPVFDPIYSALEERGTVLVFHTASIEESPIGLTRHYGRTRPRWHAVLSYMAALTFPIEAWMAWAQMVFEGVLDKHPDLRVMLTESHGGWFTTALERMDGYARGGEMLRAAYQMKLELLPSEYFQRQGFIVFEPDELAVQFAAEHIPDSMLWALDYPHAEAHFPGGTDEFRQSIAKLPETVRQGIAWDNGARAFGLT
jgi:predicted TIM-barrel fold metal-dependent hydrolase